MTPKSSKLARKLRQNQTKAESLIWTALRAKQLSQLKFRRQHPIGPFFADFACISQRTIIELDGAYHETRGKEDAAREAFLKRCGWIVLRFTNEEVLMDVDAVVISIAKQMGVSGEHARRKGGQSGMFVTSAEPLTSDEPESPEES